VTFLLGVLAAFPLFQLHAPDGIRFSTFALFIGVAMSITAFPVLARILEGRGLLGTRFGATVLACAAVDDLTAWTLLAVVVAMATTGTSGWLLQTILAIGAYLLVMVCVVRPLLGAWLLDRSSANAPRLGVVLAFVFASAAITDWIGVHALFGAFVAGAVIPAGVQRAQLGGQLEGLCNAVLVPVFFAFTGLRTQVHLLSDVTGWLVCAAVIVVAIAGKLLGGMCAAGLAGVPWPQAFRLGVLMNTRGLMELIALNIGYDLGLLSPTLFTIFVLMALTTTALTSPLLDAADAIGALRIVPVTAAPSAAPSRTV
jgi:Kef-type K+ transport system membrane component KefB